jgi:predicted dehydrogenase
VGTSSITHTFIEAAQRLAGEGGALEVTGVCSRSRERASALAAQYGIGKIYTSQDALFADKDIDCIYIGLPNSLHYPWTCAALRAGKNVICEKPFMSNAKEVEGALNCAKEQGSLLFEGLTTPHTPNFRLIQEKLPLLGPICMVSLNWSQYSSRYDELLAGKTTPMFDPACSGGALMDLNYYNICFVLHLFGEPDAPGRPPIQYFPRKAANGIDVSGVAVMPYRDFNAVCIACKDSISHSHFQLQGKAGYILGQSTCGGIREGFTLYINPPNARHYSLEGGQFFNLQQGQNVIYYELRDMLPVMLSNDKDACYTALDWSLRANRIVDQARKSAGIVFAADK